VGIAWHFIKIIESRISSFYRKSIHPCLSAISDILVVISRLSIAYCMNMGICTILEWRNKPLDLVTNLSFIVCRREI